ncbi:MAG: ribonuclease H-like domain-containing protein [Gammaproteobacteria bacterium]|nr:ribonuclease H-like domain-containing protein [Gammaproteobacteria bacterium]
MATFAQLLDRAPGARVTNGVLEIERRHVLPRAAVALHALPQVLDAADADWLYLDTETTGLSGGVGTLAFMVGLARRDGERALDVRQVVAGSFAAERAMLQALAASVTPHSVLVTFNGKAFDVPLLQARLRLHRIDCDLGGLRHLDLMYPVRRAFRRLWPDCRLQTAERCLLGLRRVDDLPGAAAPAAWRDWLRRGATVPLRGVLRHNAQDVVSLARLHARLVAVYAGGDPTPADHAALGVAWQEAGHARRARDVWQRAGRRLSADGRLALAASYRRAGDWPRATALWAGLFAEGDRRAALELSKYYEHRCRDVATAIRYAGYCAADERDRRLARLQLKQPGDRQLMLWPGGRGEPHVVAGAI